MLTERRATVINHRLRRRGKLYSSLEYATFESCSCCDKKKKKEALLYRGLKARYFNNNNKGLQESNVRRGAQNQQKLGYGKSLTFIFGIRDEKKER